MKVKALIKYDGTAECLALIKDVLHGEYDRFEISSHHNCSIRVGVKIGDSIILNATQGEWLAILYADHVDVLTGQCPPGTRPFSSKLAYCILSDKEGVMLETLLRLQPETLYAVGYIPSTHSTYTGKRFLRYEFRQSYYPLGYE